jgi:teichuronic acid biosynthesis glycosyltransferase TuaG
MQPIVSIIIPTYNSSGTLRETLLSCLSQTLSEIEILVIDDGSTDESLKSIEDLLTDCRIKYTYQKNSGRSAARNLGLETARGRYINLLDSDDRLLPEKLFQDVMFLEHHPETFAVISGTRYFSESDGTTIRVVNEETDISITTDKLALGNFIPIQSILFRATTARFDVTSSACEDWMFFLDALANKKVHQIGTIQSEVRVSRQTSLEYIRRMTIADIRVYVETVKNPLYKRHRIKIITLIARRLMQIMYYSLIAFKKSVAHKLLNPTNHNERKQ